VVVVAELGDRPVGLLVDAVCDIITVESAQIQTAPEVGRAGDTDFVRGVITMDDAIVTLLDLESALPETALAA
jgi:purine-binding chemotaxis protein CheW